MFCSQHSRVVLDSRCCGKVQQHDDAEPSLKGRGAWFCLEDESHMKTCDFNNDLIVAALGSSWFATDSDGEPAPKRISEKLRGQQQSLPRRDLAQLLLCAVCGRSSTVGGTSDLAIQRAQTHKCECADHGAKWERRLALHVGQ